MDNLWAWLLGLVALIVLAVILIPMFRRPASVAKKPDIPTRPQPREEIAEEISPTAPQIKRDEEDIFIPHNYGVDRLIVFPKDPYWLHAYWEISAAKQQEFIRTHGEEIWSFSRQVLRIFDITGQNELNSIPCSYQEISVDPFADNWFIEVGQPDRCFFLELGRVLPDGRYIKLLSSNKVTTPRASISQRVDEQWPSIEGIYQSIGKAPGGYSSEMMAGKQLEEFGPLGFSSPGYKQ